MSRVFFLFFYKFFLQYGKASEGSVINRATPSSFHMDIHIEYVCIVKYVESILRINVTSGNIYNFFN